MKITKILAWPFKKIKKLFHKGSKPNVKSEDNEFEVVKKPNPIIRFFKSSLPVKLLIFIFILFGLAQIVFGILIYGFKFNDRVTDTAAKIIPFPVAIVNYNVITVSQYQNEKDYIHHFYQSTGQTNIDYDAIDQEIINQMIENRLISMTALRYKVKVSHDDVDNTMNQIIEQNGGEENVEKVLDELYGLDLKQFKRLVKTQLLREKINEELIMKVGVRHILVRLAKDAPQDQIEAAKTKITGYLTEINNGLDFAEAAKKYSEDTSTAEQGGMIEPFSEGEMVAGFSETAFNTEVSKVSEPVRTDYGWHIIKVESRTGKIKKSFADWLDRVKHNSVIWKIKI